MSLNTADLIAFGVILLWTCYGFSKGLSGQIASLLTFLITAAVAYGTFTPCRQFLSTRLSGSGAFITAAAGVVVILVPFTVVMMIRSVSSRILQIPFIGWADRIGGALAGFISSSLLVVAVFFVANLLPSSHKPTSMGENSWIGRCATCVETNLAGAVERRMDNTAGAIQKARASRAGKREKWEE